MPRLRIYSNVRLTAAAETLLNAGLVGHERVEDLRFAEVALGQPDPEVVLSTVGIRWVQVTSAGYTAYDREDLRQALRARGAVFTKSSAVYDIPCAEHLVALMLAHVRRLPEALANQGGPRAWPQAPLRERSRLLGGETVALVGYGSIGRRIADRLRPFACDVVAIRRVVGGDEPVPTVALTDAAEVLANADHVVDLLPANASTERFFDAPRFQALKPGAVFYNIGRGTTVDQSALVAALVSGQLGAAYLDVTDPEPLPPEHPLWTAPRCVVTPHTAGGHHDESDRLVHHFLGNLEKFLDDAPLEDRII